MRTMRTAEQRPDLFFFFSGAVSRTAAEGGAGIAVTCVRSDAVDGAGGTGGTGGADGTCVFSCTGGTGGTV